MKKSIVKNKYEELICNKRRKCSILKNVKTTEKGITLIALMITIIVLLILAGVTLSLTLGERGIFKTAKEANKNYTEAQKQEQEGLNEFDKEIDKIIGDLGENNQAKVELPENGPEVANGTQVKKPSDKNWDETKINSYADGEGNTIPVPKGFTPIPVEEGQGTKDTGFVIKDTSTNADGMNSETYGNEFVWIPCEIEKESNKNNGKLKYDRYAFTRSDWSYTQTKGEKETEYGTDSYKIIRKDKESYYFYEAMPQDEKTSIETYGGYYIGRYEAGISKGSGRTASNTSETAEEIENVSGKAIIQKDKELYNYVTRNQAKGLSERVYLGKSKLCSSYGWDTALKFIETQNSTYPTNSEGGCYEQSSPTKTGYDIVHPCNIYDMGGTFVNGQQSHVAIVAILVLDVGAIFTVLRKLIQQQFVSALDGPVRAEDGGVELLYICRSRCSKKTSYKACFFQ